MPINSIFQADKSNSDSYIFSLFSPLPLFCNYPGSVVLTAYPCLTPSHISSMNPSAYNFQSNLTVSFLAFPFFLLFPYVSFCLELLFTQHLTPPCSLGVDIRVIFYFWIFRALLSVNMVSGKIIHLEIESIAIETDYETSLLQASNMYCRFDASKTPNVYSTTK